MRSLRRVFWWVAPVLGAIAGCQILAGIDDLEPHGATRGQGGSGHGGQVGSNGSGASGAGGGSSVGGGGGCSPADGQPACAFLTAFGTSTINLVPEVAAAASDGSSYFGGLQSAGQGPFGICGNPDGPCPFIQRLDAKGVAAGKSMPASTGLITLRDLSVVPGGGGVMFAGKMSNTASLTLPGKAPLIGQNNPAFIAGLTSDLSGSLWAAQLHIDEAVDGQAEVHVGVSDDGTVIGAGNVLTMGRVQWGACQVSDAPAPPGTEDVVMAKFDSTGDCTALMSFGGAGSQTADMLRVSGGGQVLLAGTYGDQILFPAGGGKETSSAASSVYYALFDHRLQVAWHGSIRSTDVVLIEGGSISRSEKRMAIAGTFLGPVPDDFSSAHCKNTGSAGGKGYVATFKDIDTDGHAPELVICLGETSQTNVFDAAIDDDGSVAIFGSTGGHVTYGSFDLTAQPTQSAAFVLKVDRNGALLWATSSTAMPRGGFLRGGRDADGFFGLGSFSAPVDFGCGCKATPVSAADVFLLQLGP